MILRWGNGGQSYLILILKYNMRINDAVLIEIRCFDGRLLTLQLIAARRGSAPANLFVGPAKRRCLQCGHGNMGIYVKGCCRMKGKPTKEQFHEQLEQLTDWLRGEIRQGGFAPGTMLPPERELASRFGMSNNSIRKGLELLVAEGWIEKIPRVGNRVGIGRPPVVLTLSCNMTAEKDLELAQLVADFERRHPWITVRVKAGASLIPGFDVGGGIDESDVLLINQFQFRQLTERNWQGRLEPMPPLPVAYPFLNGMFSFEDLTYGRPIAFAPIVLVYNKAHFREAGLPEPHGGWTWDEMMRAAAALSDGEGRYGFCFHLPSINRWPLFLLQSEEYLKQGKGGVRDIRGSRLLESIRLCKRILHNRDVFPLYMSDDNRDMNQMFAEGKISMVLNSYMSLNEWKNSELDYDISPLPYIRHPATLVISIAAVVNESSPHKEAARLFVDYAASREGQETVLSHTLSIPTHQELAGRLPGPAVRAPGRYGLYREIMSSYRTHDDLQLSTSEIYKLFTVLKPYWANMENEDALCERISRTFDKLER